VTNVQGQASAEYAVLLALAAVLGATLALIAGPPLAHVIRHVLVSALSGSAGGPSLIAATAADVADVQSALVASDAVMTPDAALLALSRRHGNAGGRKVADALLLQAARSVAPWIARSIRYQAWKTLDDGPFEAGATPGGDHDTETPTGEPEVRWITVARGRAALARILGGRASSGTLALDILALVPTANPTGLRALRSRAAIQGVARVADRAAEGAGLVNLANIDDGDITGGTRAGDVLVSWRVHRTFWRDGHWVPAPFVDLVRAFGNRLPREDYWHVVFLRPGTGGLVVIDQGFGT
jgi:hypothetical protein